MGSLGQTWRVLLPVSSAVLIQITLLLLNFGYKLFKKLINHIGLGQKNNVDSSQFKYEKDKRSFTFDLNESSSNKTRTLDIVSNVGYKVFAGVRSLVFSALIDGYSHTGLWSSALFASWALWNKVYYLPLEFSSPRSIVGGITKEGAALATAVLGVAMLSYCINIFIVLRTAQHRTKCLVVAVLFTIFPVYIHIMAAYQNKATWEAVFSSSRALYDADFVSSIDAAIPTLITIITAATLIMVICIIAVVMGIIKERKQEKQNRKRRIYFAKQMKKYKAQNVDGKQNHTI